MSNTLFDSSLTPPAANPAVPSQTLCPSDLPLVLLPVRLETRFFTLPGNVTELRIRVYPDKIHIDTHEPELTTAERTWGTEYWQADWAAGSGADARREAWRVLADRFGAARAAWIVRALEPTNLQQRPTAPVPEGQPPAVTPVFPALPPVTDESSWRRAPQAKLLPDRWVAVLHSAGQVALTVTGGNIRRPLAVGPDPLAPKPDADTTAAIERGDRLAMDDGMKWMVDFEEAERAGMGLRVTIPSATLTAGLDSLLVFGVLRSLGVADTAAQLGDLLDAHHYTDGLEFLRYGAPTNNTDDRRAGYDSEDPGHTRSFGNEIMTDPQRSVNASRVGGALGLPFPRIAPTLGRLGQAAQDHDLDLRSMNTALWQVGWGYYLSNMMGAATGLTPGSIDWARAHFVNWVRGGGPFPALRFGPQPYGILPVTSLDLWAPNADEGMPPQEIWLRNLLVGMRDKVWRPVLDRVARIGARRPPDPDADLADVMRMDGVSYGYLARRVLGRQYVEHLASLNSQSISADLQAQDTVAARMLNLLGLPAQAGHRPRLAQAFHSDGALRVTAPLVQPGEVSPWQPLQPDYIGALLTAPTIQAVIDARPGPAASDHGTGLLQQLLRHALLRELATAAARLAASVPGSDLAVLLRDLELVDLVDIPPAGSTLQTPPMTPHWRRQLDLTVPAVPAGTTIRHYLEGLTNFTTPPVMALGEFRTSLAHLHGMDSESLQLLTQSTLDLSAHRLDAWITSFATKRLALMTDGPQGQYVGGYGWVENLKPADGHTPLPAASLPPGEPGPLYAQPGDSGFIHAPSMNHATTAALLRNAHLGPDGVPEADGPFAIDLSSRRVRDAGRLLDGVRQGQPLGALLGYRLERRLHDLQLDRFVAPLRNLAPLAVRERETGQKQAEAIAAGNVVDALTLLRRYDEQGSAMLSTTLTTATTAELIVVAAELAALYDAVDAVADGLTAEAAHQLAQGNTPRLASTLSAIAQGDAPPPELEVTQVPRAGNSLTHRTAVLFSGTANAGGGWLSYNATPRPLSERWLGGWVRQLLGDARTIRCTVERLDDATGAVAESVRFPLNDVPVTALDFMYFTGTDQQAAQSYAEQLVLYHARRRTGGFGAQATLRLQHTRPGDLATGETTLFDALEQGRAIGRLLEGARGLLPDDLSPPGSTSPATTDVTELESRVVRLENSLNAFHKALATFVSKGMTTVAEDFRTVLLNLSLLGLGRSVPCVATGDDASARGALLRQASAVLKDSGPRLERCLALRAAAAQTDPRARVRQLVERGQAVCGKEFVMLPYLGCDAAGAAELGSALAASTQQQGGDAFAVHGWYARTSRVRDNLARLGTCLRLADVLGARTRLNLSIAQLPFAATERWVGLPLTDGAVLPPNKLSLVIQSTQAIDPTQPLCGLLVDEWVEIVPNATQTTALTFQSDPPNSFPPQNILVAAPPVRGQDWTTETLRRVLMETLDLAKLRAVDPSLLGAAGQYLPALYVPFNAADDAVSTDFTPLTA